MKFMLNRRWIPLTVCLTTFLLCRAADALEPKANDDDDGWIVLFDGKTLDGWHKNPEKIGHGTGGHWFVEEGVIAGEQDPPGSGNGGILLTDRKFGDFELTIDMKPDWGVCSGLFVRCKRPSRAS